MFRISLWFTLVCIWFFLIIARLSYWQVLTSGKLSEAASSQHFFKLILPGKRGEILSHDKSPLVSNKTAFLVYAEPHKITDKNRFIGSISEVLTLDKSILDERLSQDGVVWVTVSHKVDEDKMKQLEELNLEGLGFEKEAQRFYPEASLAAQLVGFVAQDSNGEDKGYFGVEGFYNRELKGRDGFLVREKDARGLPIVLSDEKRIEPQNGRIVILHLNKSVQRIVEEKLNKGIEKYGAKEGYVVVMDPASGGIVGMAGYPSFDPRVISDYPRESYANPGVTGSYEPGSTFKTLVMSAAFNKGAVTPETKYNEEGPIRIGDYTIKTWNGEYNGEVTMREVLQHSSNVGMVFIQQELGRDAFISSLKSFGLGALTGVDLEGEVVPEMRGDNEWLEIDLATASFGQGIAVTPIQMVTAVGSLANEGKLMKPHVAKTIIDQKEKTIEIKPEVVRRVISPKAAKEITDLMVYAVDNGEAKWAKPKGYRIAGKTGTAQIPVAGHYDDEKTIASFVGFAPADDPQFVMLVILREPTSSPWGSETAAPLFFDIARDMFTHYSIAPEN